MRSHVRHYKSIVLVGKFNPSIFQPFWFVAQKLIGEQDGDGAELKIAHPDVVNFKLRWCDLEVTRERFVVTTTQEHAFELIRDMALATFNLLSHTPISQLGINTEMHFDLKNEEKWHTFGHRLAPKDPYWSNTMINPGMLSVAIEGRRPDEYKGRVNVETRPSDKVQFGVSIRVNDHYEVGDSKTIMGASEIIKIIETDWINAQERAHKIIGGVLSTAAS